MTKLLKRIYKLDALLNPGKVFVLYGPRQVGKTTLVDEFLKETKLIYKKDSGDSIHAQEIFGSQNFDTILEYAKGYDLIVIHEA